MEQFVNTQGITKKQALNAGYRAEFHYGTCERTVGPRGGITIDINRGRVNGMCRTWKKQPERFRLPIKIGMYGYDAITQDNAADWHSRADCPLNDLNN